jgi:hypothetical protein
MLYSYLMLQLIWETGENSKSGMSYFIRISHYRTSYCMTFFIESFYTETDRMNMSIKWRTTASADSRSRFQLIRRHRSRYNSKRMLHACPAISYRSLRSPVCGSRQVEPPSAFSLIRCSCRGTDFTLLNIEEVSYNYHVSYYIIVIIWSNSEHVWLDLEY